MGGKKLSLFMDKTDTFKCEHSGECTYFSVHRCLFLMEVRIYFLELEREKVKRKSRSYGQSQGSIK